MGRKQTSKKSSSSAVYLTLDDIVLSKRNRKALRRDRGQIDKMRAELERGSRLLPITVSLRPEGGYTIVDGRHRFLAAELAGFSGIEAIIKG